MHGRHWWQIFIRTNPPRIICPQYGGNGGTSTQKFLIENNDRARPDRWQSVVTLGKKWKPVIWRPQRKDEDNWTRYNATDALGNIGNRVVSTILLVHLMINHALDTAFITVVALWKPVNPKSRVAIYATSDQDFRRYQYLNWIYPGDSEPVISAIWPAAGTSLLGSSGI